METECVELRCELVEHLLDLRNDLRIIFLVPHLDHQTDLFVLILELVVLCDRIFQVFRFLHESRGFLRILPEARLLHGLVQLVDPSDLRFQIQGVPDLLQWSFICG